jgi:hypothetical protein
MIATFDQRLVIQAMYINDSLERSRFELQSHLKEIVAALSLILVLLIALGQVVGWWQSAGGLVVDVGKALVESHLMIVERVGIVIFRLVWYGI